MPRNWHGYKCKNRVSIDLGIGNNIRNNIRTIGCVVQYYKVTYICEETMFLVEPIIEAEWNGIVLHVHPYIGEVVEHFSSPWV